MTEDQVKVLSTILIDHASGFRVTRPKEGLTWGISYFCDVWADSTIHLTSEFCTEHDVALIAKVSSDKKIEVQIGYEKQESAL